MDWGAPNALLGLEGKFIGADVEVDRAVRRGQ